MCGIVAAVAQRDVTPLLIAGLKALEYRGYDSAGLAVLEEHTLHRIRAKGKVRDLASRYKAAPFSGHTGIGHTRWATHGQPNEINAHPHMVGRVAVVHNGIIENYAELCEALEARGQSFSSQTDTEVIAALINEQLDTGLKLIEAVQRVLPELQGAYALAVISRDEPHSIVGVRRSAPLLIGMGVGEYFLSSDAQALIQFTNRMIHLHEDDIVHITRESVQIVDRHGQALSRPLRESELRADAVERGPYRHYMYKEILDQPGAVASTLEARIDIHGLLSQLFTASHNKLLSQVQGVHIIACGTSYHAGLIARYWIEELARLPVAVEVASEYRYRQAVVAKGTLFVALSQSGETADTLAALRAARERDYLGTLAICNVPESSLVREADLVLMTRAGPEIGVASTKAFTTQLTVLALLSLRFAHKRGLRHAPYLALCKQLCSLPRMIAQALQCEADIKILARHFMHRHHALFLGRGTQFPVALEGALKLKEISYIHAEAYPAGELKHGPLALVDEAMPVIAVVPDTPMLDKMKSNLQEVRTRGGLVIVLADYKTTMKTSSTHHHLLCLDTGGEFVAPIVFTVALQLLAYHVAVLRGTDVDQPRNLAKAVTVE